MLADTASWSWVWRATSMLAGEMCPNERVRGSRTSTGTGVWMVMGATKTVSSAHRARGWGASMSAHRAGIGPGLRTAWGAARPGRLVDHRPAAVAGAVAHDRLGHARVGLAGPADQVPGGHAVGW